jgi:signal peptidase
LPLPGRLAVAAFMIRLLIAAVVMAASTTMISLFVWTVLPFCVGWSPSVIVTGSMEPSIVPGDIVVTAPIEPEALRLGYVIRFKDPSHTHPYLMHRIMEIRDDGTLITQGDANRSRDSTPVPVGNVTGVARLRVPLVGLPAMWLRNGQFLQLGLAMLTVAIAAWVLTGLRALVTTSPWADAADVSEPHGDEPPDEPTAGDPNPGVPGTDGLNPEKPD